jgi:metal-responsive CopG/Arc/MetJ family transcriptional regulator
MVYVKTAVSLPRALFERSEALAERLHVSRSRVFAMALEEFIRRHENQALLERINAAYRGSQDSSERALRKVMRRQARRLLGGGR